jgi:hypothetical protein
LQLEIEAERAAGLRGDDNLAAYHATAGLLHRSHGYGDMMKLDIVATCTIVKLSSASSRQTR